MVDPVGMSEGMTRAACVQGYDFLQPIRKASAERDECRRDVCERDPPLELRFSGQQEKKYFLLPFYASIAFSPFLFDFNDWDVDFLFPTQLFWGFSENKKIFRA